MAAEAGETPLLRNLPDEIVIWEILVRLDPKSLLQCRAVRRDWRSATSSRDLLLAHHARQPALCIFSYRSYCRNVTKDMNQDFFVLDHQAEPAQFHTVLRLDHHCQVEASCDGLLVLSMGKRSGFFSSLLTVCNPTTREIASLGLLPDFNIWGMYLHRPTGEYRLLLQGRRHERRGPSSDLTGFYVLALGSHQPPRYVGGSEPKFAEASFNTQVWLRDCLHSNVSRRRVIVFDTIAESLREMRAPLVTTRSYIFEMDGTLGFYTCNNMTTAQIVDIWVLRDYETEVWDLKYQVELPIEGIRGMPEGRGIGWYLNVASGDGDVLLLVCFARKLFIIDTDGKLVDTLQRIYYHRNQQFKQTLVRHDFFAALEGYVVNASPFIPSLPSDTC